MVWAYKEVMQQHRPACDGEIWQCLERGLCFQIQQSFDCNFCFELKYNAKKLWEFLYRCANFRESNEGHTQGRMQ